jgi:hypothetical protein
VDVAAEDRDGLDDMITGLKNGSVPEEEQEEAVSPHSAMSSDSVGGR